MQSSANRESRHSRPTLTIALERYELSKDNLLDHLKYPPEEALDTSVMVQFGRTAKELYHKYASDVKILMNIYATCGSINEQKELFAEKNNMRDEVDISISFTNAVTEEARRFGIADTISLLSVSTLSSALPNNVNQVVSPTPSVVPTIDNYQESETDSVIVDPEMIRRNQCDDKVVPRNPSRLNDNEIYHGIPETNSPQHFEPLSGSHKYSETSFNSPETTYYDPPVYKTAAKHPITQTAYNFSENTPKFQPHQLYPASPSFNQPNYVSPVQIPLNYNTNHTNNPEIVTNHPNINYRQPPPVTVGSNPPPHPPVPYYIPAPDSASLHLVKQEFFKKPANPFKGDPDKFLVWYPSVTNMMRGINFSAFDQLLILEAHTEGEPQKMIREKIAIGGSNPYLALKECWDDLFHNYGSGNQIAEALINKIDMIQPIKSVHHTDKLKDLLSICKLILANMPMCKELQIFDLSLGIKKIFFKLPDSFQDGWREQELNYQHTHGQSAPLTQLVSYIERKILKYSIPAYRRVAFSSNETKKVNTFENKPQKNLHSYQTLKDETSIINENIVSENEKHKRSENDLKPLKPDNQQKPTDKNTPCILHENGNHLLKDCNYFSRLTHDKKELCVMKRACAICVLKDIASVTALNHLTVRNVIQNI